MEDITKAVGIFKGTKSVSVSKNNSGDIIQNEACVNEQIKIFYSEMTSFGENLESINQRLGRLEDKMDGIMKELRFIKEGRPRLFVSTGGEDFSQSFEIVMDRKSEGEKRVITFLKTNERLFLIAGFLSILLLLIILYVLGSGSTARSSAPTEPSRNMLAGVQVNGKGTEDKQNSNLKGSSIMARYELPKELSLGSEYWVLLDTERGMYFDIANLVYKNGMIDVWTREAIYSRDGNYVLNLWEIDCKRKEFVHLTQAEYSEQGELIRATNFDRQQKKRPVVGIYERLCESVCNKNYSIAVNHNK